MLQIECFSLRQKNDPTDQKPAKRFFSLNHPLMEEKLKAREKVLKPAENHQNQLANLVEEEEHFTNRKELDEITNEIFALMLDLKFALDHKNDITPTTEFENALNEATAVSLRSA